MARVFKRFDATLVMLVVAFSGLIAYLMWPAATPVGVAERSTSRPAAAPAPVNVVTPSSTVQASPQITPRSSLNNTDVTLRLRSDLVSERELRHRMQRERDAAIKQIKVLEQQLKDATAGREAAERELRALRRSALPQPENVAVVAGPRPVESNRVFSSSSPMLNVVGRALQPTAATAVPPAAPRAERTTRMTASRRVSVGSDVEASPYAPRRKARQQPAKSTVRVLARGQRPVRQPIRQSQPVPSPPSVSPPGAVTPPVVPPTVVERPERTKRKVRRGVPRTRVSSRFVPTYRLGRRNSAPRRSGRRRGYRPSFRQQLRQNGFFGHSTAH